METVKAVYDRDNMSVKTLPKKVKKEKEKFWHYKLAEYTWRALSYFK